MTDWYADEARRAGHELPDGMPCWPSWSAEEHLKLMDRNGIETSVLSVSSPGTHFGDDAAARALARRLNDFGADVTRNHPGRFGLFASLPLPDIDGALDEITYALDTLGADGVILETNVHGVYLGDSLFEPVFAELNRRGAVAFIHPTSPTCWQQCALGQPRPMIEFIFDTARAITNLLITGTLDRYSQLQMIVPHCGGALPVVADRINGLISMVGGDSSPEVIAQLRRLYYDTAGTPFPRQVAALLNLVGASQLLYGSDYPWTPSAAVEMHAASFSAAPVPAEDATWQSLTTANAKRLLPRLGHSARSSQTL